jgi:hypothetical protein
MDELKRFVSEEGFHNWGWALETVGPKSRFSASVSQTASTLCRQGIFDRVEPGVYIKTRGNVPVYILKEEGTVANLYKRISDNELKLVASFPHGTEANLVREAMVKMIKDNKLGIVTYV